MICFLLIFSWRFLKLAGVLFSVPRGLSNYRFFKPLFYAGFFLVLLVAVFLVSFYGFSSYHYEYCDSPVGYCLLSDGSVVDSGWSVGVKPPFVVQNFFWLVLVFFALLFLFNHLLFNRRVG